MQYITNALTEVASRRDSAAQRLVLASNLGERLQGANRLMRVICFSARKKPKAQLSFQDN